MSNIVKEQDKLYKEYHDELPKIDPDEFKRLARPHSLLGKLISVLFIALCIFFISRFTVRVGEWYFFGGLMFVYLLVKEFFALFYRPSKKELTKPYKVSAIITCYNEEPRSVVSILESIMKFEYCVHEVLFLDDGSKNSLAYEVAKSFAKDHEHLPNAPKFNIIRFDENRGKRAVLIDGFHAAEGDYLFLLDSDSVLAPNALTELLRPFEDGKTTSCVGHIGILNRKENFLTRLQALTYFNAFHLGRAAQSVLGSVVICSGAFSVHRKDIILENLDKFEIKSFLGVKVSNGDDRTLTFISKLAGGKTRYQSTAYCATKVPAKWKTFQKQRRRWQRSGYIYTLRAIKELFPKRLPFLFWSFAETYFWLVALVLFIISVLRNGISIDWIDIIMFHIILSYKQNVFYLLYRPLHLLFAPIYSAVYSVSLIITRIYAAITIKNDGWGTRDKNDDDSAGKMNRSDDRIPQQVIN